MLVDTDLLKDFSQGRTSEDKLHDLAQQQYEQLTHAMTCKFVIREILKYVVNLRNMNTFLIYHNQAMRCEPQVNFPEQS